LNRRVRTKALLAAEGMDRGMIAGAAPTPKAVALVLLPALVLMLAFAFSYVGAFHEPTPHNVPLAVVGPASVATQLDQLPGDPLDTRESPSRSDALSQIDDRKVYGAYDAATNRLFVASAANRATAIALERTFDRVAAAQGRPAVRVTDVKPLPPKDPNGTAAFYAVFALVAGIHSVILLRVCFGVFAGHVVALCAIGALTIFASGAATAGIQAAAGPAGTGLVILLFVILGTALVVALGGRIVDMVEAETEAAAGAAV
jgi:hypothetical protein